MPTIKELYEHIQKVEAEDPGEGAYPIFFNNELSKVKFILYCRWRKFLKKVKRLWRK